MHVALTETRVLIGTATTVNELVRTREVYPRGPSNQHRHSRHPDDPLPVCCCRLLHGLYGAGPQRARATTTRLNVALLRARDGRHRHGPWTDDSWAAPVLPHRSRLFPLSPPLPGLTPSADTPFPLQPIHPVPLHAPRRQEV